MIQSLRYCSFYHSNLCHVCKQSSENLKRCSNCKCLAYCSKEHQKADWKIHKELCKVISSTEKDFFNFEVKAYEDFQTLRYMRCAAWQNKLNRPLENFENQIWMFPKVCVVCYSKNVKIDCRNCLNVSYCSKNHEEVYSDIHRRYCDALRLNMEVDVYNMNEGYKPLGVDLCEIPLKVKKLPKNLGEFMDLFGNNTSTKNPGDKMQFIIKADYISPAANILYGLEKSNLLVDRSFIKRCLTVHVVGADVVEMSWQWTVVLELFFHWIKNLRTLRFNLIGPEIGESWTLDNIEKDFCQNCRDRKVKASCTFYSNFYHDVEPTLETPSIIAAFNSGIHAYSENLWTNSIDLLTKIVGVPLVLTAYTQSELKSDVDIVVKHCGKKVEVVVDPKRNPFSCMKPMRDFNTCNIPIFFVNGYIAILLRNEEDK